MTPFLDVTFTGEGGPHRYRKVQAATVPDGRVALVGKARTRWPTEPVGTTSDERAVIVAYAPGPVEVEGKGLGKVWTLGEGWSGTKSQGCGCGVGFLTQAARKLEEG